MGCKFWVCIFKKKNSWFTLQLINISVTWLERCVWDKSDMRDVSSCCGIPGAVLRNAGLDHTSIRVMVRFIQRLTLPSSAHFSYDVVILLCFSKQKGEDFTICLWNTAGIYTLRLIICLFIIYARIKHSYMVLCR